MPRKNASKKSSAKRTKRTKSTKSKSVSFNKKVLAVVNKVAETKMKVVANLNNAPVVSGSGLDLASGMGYAIPRVMDAIGLLQGTTNDTRIGNKISDCKFRIAGFIETLPYHGVINTSQKPFELHMVVLKAKNGLPVTNAWQDVKQYPGNAVGPVDDLMATCYPWNTDNYIIKKHKVFKFGATFPYISGSALTDVTVGYDPKFYFQRFSVDIPVSKTMTFNDGSDTPNDIQYSIIWYVMNGDGTQLTANQERCQITYASYFSFKDT